MGHRNRQLDRYQQAFVELAERCFAIVDDNGEVLRAIDAGAPAGELCAQLMALHR
ncbi:hypothetical protein D3C80_2218040 [compost metagenome]